MAQVMKLTKMDPTVHIKAYAGVKIQGGEEPEITCEIDAPQLVTMVEEGDHVYITVNSHSNLIVPNLSKIEIERGMGSVKIAEIKNPIKIEKVLGNLVLSDVLEADVSKVGGNFSVKGSEGLVRIEKVGGNLYVANVGSFRCEKIGGNCKVCKVQGDFYLDKAGGSIKAQDILGGIYIRAVGGSFSAKNVSPMEDLRVGGDIRLINISLSKDNLMLRAGGDIHIELDDLFEGATFRCHSGSEDIRIKYKDVILTIDEEVYTYQLGSADQTVEAYAGGSIVVSELIHHEEDLVGDMTDHYDFEETRYSEMIRERIESATRMAEAKLRAAEIRLDQMRDHLEKNRIHIEGIGSIKDEDMIPPKPSKPSQPVPPVSRPVGKKGASDEERLMILKMLQEKKITVDEAETLFKALED